MAKKPRGAYSAESLKFFSDNNSISLQQAEAIGTDYSQNFVDAVNPGLSKDERELNKRIEADKRKTLDELPLVTCYTCGLDFIVRRKLRRSNNYVCDKRHCCFVYYQHWSSAGVVLCMTPEQAARVPQPGGHLSGGK